MNIESIAPGMGTAGWPGVRPMPATPTRQA
jgi:hypothetical protein